MYVHQLVRIGLPDDQNGSVLNSGGAVETLVSRALGPLMAGGRLVSLSMVRGCVLQYPPNTKISLYELVTQVKTRNCLWVELSAAVSIPEVTVVTERAKL